jgi:alpha-mannosidase
LYATHFDGTKGTYPLTNRGIALSRKGILVTAYGKNRDGDGTILRLWEQSGSEGQCNISLPSGSNFKKAVACNLRGELTESPEIPIVDGQFSVLMKPNKPATYILR